MITWYNVYRIGQPTFGFAVKNGVIINFIADYKLVGRLLQNNRDWFLRQNATVVKIAEQLCHTS